MQGMPYGKMIGHILWPVMISQPNMVFMAGILAQFIQNPGPAHLKTLKCGILYLYTTCDIWLTFGGKDTELIGYTNADWALQPDHHSVLGYTFIFGAGAVTWSSKEQPIIAQMHSVKELVWLQAW